MAIYKEEIVGYISFNYIFDIEIESVIVKSSYQRQGIGSLLLDYIFDFAEEHKINNVFLEVRKSNFAAISLYKKLGFKEISVRKNYYKNNEDALILKKIVNLSI
jgi:ribosomal-protein-alanine N-acetyltransferase